MFSFLILLGLLPAGLLLSGTESKDAADEAEESEEETPDPAPTTAIDAIFDPPPPAPVTDAPGPADQPQPDPPLPEDSSLPLDGPEAPPPAPETTDPGSKPVTEAEAAPAPQETPRDTLSQPTDIGLDPVSETGDADPAPEAPNDPEIAPEDPDGSDLMLGPEDGDTSLSGFRPGQDVLDIEVDGTQITAFRSLDPQTGDPQLRLFDGDSEQVITFAGLGAVPIDDIFLLMTDPETGDALSVALLDVLFNEAEALDPIPPETPSVIEDPQQGPPIEPGLEPIPADMPRISDPDPVPASDLDAGPSPGEPVTAPPLPPPAPSADEVVEAPGQTSQAAAMPTEIRAPQA